ncbi:MAG: DUF2934 domain-containing protein [Hyphomicrobiales bacterium]|nr:DUF2934 domain-containing protein [Hyphomicrobiales bacterium]MBV8440970.1 DUF2934 domain-containing protein [Hyphomicrobiales bacterium]
MNALDEMIRKRAHELWEKAGMPEGRSEEFWFAARAEFDSEAPAGKPEADVPAPPPTASPAPPAAKPAAKGSGAARPATKPRAKKT